MLLKKLEIYGFKSFADRIEIDFDKGITAIVGPNGSGKSNVADAIRWVLGEQSAKSLRGSKMEDIIFSGTQVRKPLGFAEVSLTLDNTDGSLPLEYSEITVTRRVFRSGESEYYINKTPCRLKDITELFMDTGVGKEGYSIIGQGRIEDILSSQSENRRQVFEEAAGIVKYKTRKQESERKLAATYENIIRVEDIIGEIEHRLDPLEEQSRVAKEYLKLRDQLKVYDLNKFILEYDSNKKRIDEMGKNASILDRDIENHRKSLKDREDRANNLEKELAKLNMELQTLQDNRYGILNEKEKLRGKIEVIRERISQLERDSQRLEKEIESGKETILRAQEERERTHKELKEANISLDKALRESEELKERLLIIQDELSKGHMDAQEKKDRMMETLSALSEARNNITKYKTQKTGLEEQIKNLDSRIEDLVNSRESLKDRYEDLRADVEGLEMKLDEKNREKAGLDKSIKNLKDSLAEWDNRLQLQRQRLEGDKSKLKLLVDMERTYEGYQKSVKGILMACQKNPAINERVLGVVAELLKVPEEYEVAIETALGASLQHIVTENEEDAKYIIEFLRERRLGRATFLPISAIKGRDLYNRELKALSMEGSLGRGVDLIEFDPKYRDIFNNLLGRVLVTENLDQAIAIAKRFSYSFRIVTLKGDIVNAGGSMTGGSLNRRNAGIIGRSREIDDLKAGLTGLIKDMERGTEEKETLLEKYSELKATLSKTLDDIHDLEIQMAAGKEHLEGIGLQMGKADREGESLKDTRIKLHKDILTMEEAIERQRELIKDLETRDKDLREMADNADSSIEDINKEKAKADEENTKLEIGIAGLRHEIRSLKDRQEGLERDIKIHQRNIDEKTRERKDNAKAMETYRAEIIGHDKEIEELSQRSKEGEEELLKKQSAKEDLSREIGEIEKSKKELMATIDHIRDRKHSMEMQLSRAEMELDAAQNNIWEEYEVSYAHALKFRDESLTLTGIKREIQELKGKISALGNINIGAIDEYRRERERYDFLTGQKNDLLRAKENLEEVIKEITETMEGIFAEEFAIINEHFNRVFRSLFGGGKAELILEEPDDVLGSGIEIVAQPPGKKLQSISLLSGGEKTLTAISILFAILEHKPTPFCVLDEIEAALDASNVQNFGKYVRKFSEKTQFVLITHRRGTMENSDVLYGVAMEEKGVSKLISVKLDEDMAS